MSEDRRRALSDRRQSTPAADVDSVSERDIRTSRPDANHNSAEHALRVRIEQQQRTLDLLHRRSQARPAAPPVLIRPVLKDAPRKTSRTAEKAEPTIWPNEWWPHWALTPPPGFASYSISANTASAVLISVLGVSATDIEGKLAFVSELQERSRNFAPVFLSDLAHHRPFAMRGYVVEYLPSSGYRMESGKIDAARLRSKLRILWRKWKLKEVIDLSPAPLLGIVPAEFETVRTERRSQAEIQDQALVRHFQHPLSATPLGARRPSPERLRSFLDYEWGASVASEIMTLVDEAVPPGKGKAGSVPLSLQKLKKIGRWRRRASSLATPELSIIIPVHNQIRYTLACLHSIFLYPPAGRFEILIGDDGSTDGTATALQKRFPNVRVVIHHTNLGFLRNCNVTAQSARGRYLLFLNNDILVLPGSIDAMVATLAEDDQAGLVGARLVSADGTLQEAGAFIFSDAAGWNYGRGGDPLDPAFNFVREADYCSGAAIAITNNLWNEIGGFDERFVPAYYEDTDLAFRVRKAGRRVVCQPRAAFIHFEGISHGNTLDSGIKRFQVSNRKKFQRKWRDELPKYGVGSPTRFPSDRFTRGTVLVIDAEIPRPDSDSGSIDAFESMRIIRRLAYHVIFVPANLARPEPYTSALRAIGVETLVSPYSSSLEDAIRSVGHRVDVAMLSRAAVAEQAYPLVRHYCPKAKIIFNTVDLHHLRLEREADLTGNQHARRAAESIKKVELGLVRRADATIVVSEHEAALLRKLAPGAKIVEVPIVRSSPSGARAPYAARRHLAFVGGFRHRPNGDAVQYFIGSVWPLLRSAGFRDRFIVAGSYIPSHIERIAEDGVEIRGFVPDIAELMNECRLTVAPLRYGAGAKGKIVTSISYGVPVVATSVAAEGMGATPGNDIVVADEPAVMAAAILSIYNDPVRWNALSSRCLQLFERRFSAEANATRLATLISGLEEEPSGLSVRGLLTA